MSTAYAISEGYFATTDQPEWCPSCLKPSCVDEAGATSLLIGAHSYCFEHQGWVG